ncbi:MULTISPECIES: PPC domain-containing DNA-binding protein [Acidaminococcus]|jgi:predicted DNA-binding protein with PD1-like motif|uniref:PPC domain-containing DNA-binding protein n=1 Tax=Acidaminococcus TaxID=904 RepID=UPI00094EF2B2|nr:PPC domain-containing DNA-binding protein [Acidaminococcus massiliensis]
MTDFAEVFIDQGQDIRKTIEAFVIEKGWKEVIVVNAIGSVKDLILAAPISNELPLKVGRTPCYGAAEILSFTGEVMVKEKMDPQLRQVYPDTDSPLFIHIHASCARAGGLVMGGGLWGGTAFRSLRVFLRPVE